MKDVKNFILANKGGGNTRLLREIGNQVDCHIFTMNSVEGKSIKGNIQIERLFREDFSGPRKPVFFDNQVIVHIIDTYEEELIKSGNLRLEAQGKVETLESNLSIAERQKDNAEKQADEYYNKYKNKLNSSASQSLEVQDLKSSKDRYMLACIVLLGIVLYQILTN